MAEQLSWDEYESHVAAAIGLKLAAQGEKALEAERMLMNLFGRHVGTQLILALEKVPMFCEDCGEPFRQWCSKVCYRCDERRAMDTALKEEIRFFREMRALKD